MYRDGAARSADYPLWLTSSRNPGVSATSRLCPVMRPSRRFSSPLVRHHALCALAAPMRRHISLVVLVVLGLSGAPFHARNCRRPTPPRVRVPGSRQLAPGRRMPSHSQGRTVMCVAQPGLSLRRGPQSRGSVPARSPRADGAVTLSRDGVGGGRGPR